MIRRTFLKAVTAVMIGIARPLELEESVAGSEFDKFCDEQNAKIVESIRIHRGLGLGSGNYLMIEFGEDLTEPEALEKYGDMLADQAYCVTYKDELNTSQSEKA